jgi:hypothetical protein
VVADHDELDEWEQRSQVEERLLWCRGSETIDDAHVCCGGYVAHDALPLPAVGGPPHCDVLGRDRGGRKPVEPRGGGMARVRVSREGEQSTDGGHDRRHLDVGCDVDAAEQRLVIRALELVVGDPVCERLLAREGPSYVERLAATRNCSHGDRIRRRRRPRSGHPQATSSRRSQPLNR